MRLKVPNLREN